MTVLHLISSAGFYGAEAMLVTLAGALARLSAQVSIGVFRNEHVPHTEVADRARAIGIDVRMIACRGRCDWSAVTAIRDTARRCGADVIHTHGYKASLYGYAAAHSAGIPIVATCHNWTGQDTAVRVYERLDRLVLRRFTRVAAVSEPVAERLLACGLSPLKVRVIRNGIDAAAFAGPRRREARRVVIGMVGRLVPEKGPEDLLTAAARIAHRRPETEIVFTGDGPDRARLLRSAEALGVASQVRFDGWRDDMPAVYGDMDVFVLPSRNEAMPMSVLEAMAAGVPVVATAVGDVPRMVVDGETGLLVAPGDVDGLERALERLVGDAAGRAAMGERARAAVVERFSADAMARQYMQLYGEASSAGLRPAPAARAEANR